MTERITKNQKKVKIGEPVLTRYERARIVGARALQISHGAPVLIQTDDTDFRPHDVANRELRARVLPIGLARRLPNARIQIIPLHWLKDREFITQIDVEEEEISATPTPSARDSKEVKSKSLDTVATTEVEEEINEDLTSIKGVGSSTAESLIEEGYKTVKSVADASPEDLAKIRGISKSKAQEFIATAKSLL